MSLLPLWYGRLLLQHKVLCFGVIIVSLCCCDANTFSPTEPQPVPSSGRNKRSSMHRPVLQLQVKPDTLDRVRRRAGSNGSVMMSRSALQSLARESAAYGEQLGTEA